MAAYKRSLTVPVRREPTQITPHHKHGATFSLHSVRSNSQKAQKIEGKTLTVFRSKFRPNQWNSC